MRPDLSSRNQPLLNSCMVQLLYQDEITSSQSLFWDRERKFGKAAEVFYRLGIYVARNSSWNNYGTASMLCYSDGDIVHCHLWIGNYSGLSDIRMFFNEDVFQSKNVIDHDNHSNYTSTSFPNIRSRLWTHFNLLDHFWDPIFVEIPLESAILLLRKCSKKSADTHTQTDTHTNERTHTHEFWWLSHTIGPSGKIDRGSNRKLLTFRFEFRSEIPKIEVFEFGYSLRVVRSTSYWTHMRNWPVLSIAKVSARSKHFCLQKTGFLAWGNNRKPFTFKCKLRCENPKIKVFELGRQVKVVRSTSYCTHMCSWPVLSIVKVSARSKYFCL